MYQQYDFITPALKDLVRSAWSVSYATSSEPMPGIIAPDAHVEILFQTGAPCATKAEGTVRASPSPRAMVFGLRHGALRLVPTGENAIVGIRVAPAVASVVLGCPLIDCWDRPVPLSTFIGSDADELLEQHSACFGGHLSEPYEQNTQQSPVLGFSNARQPVHS